jgi:hypothetical protein
VFLHTVTNYIEIRLFGKIPSGKSVSPHRSSERLTEVPKIQSKAMDEAGTEQGFANRQIPAIFQRCSRLYRNSSCDDRAAPVRRNVFQRATRSNIRALGIGQKHEDPRSVRTFQIQAARCSALTTESLHFAPVSKSLEVVLPESKS